jgi:hypothetical protein
MPSAVTQYKGGGEVSEGTRHEMEHKDTINKIKRKDISTKDVARAIAKDHLKEDKNYYKKLDIVENHTLAEIMSEHEKNRSRKLNRKKFKFGGNTMYQPHLVHLVFYADHQAPLYTNEGKYDSDVHFKKDVLYKMEFLNNKGTETALQFPNTNKYVILPNELITIKGYDMKYRTGGNVPAPYESYSSLLSENDIQILNMLRSDFRVEEDGSSHFTIAEKEKLSTFKGTNLVNQLSTNFISKLFGLMFQYHQLEYPIQRLYIKNVGVGNLLKQAPIFLKEIIVSHDENPFFKIEEEICVINNFEQYNKSWGNFRVNKEDGLNAIMYCYPATNPKTDTLSNLSMKAQKGCLSVGVCEFTDHTRMKHFVVNVKLAQSISNVKCDFVTIEKGITNNGKVTLVYLLRKL